MEHMTLTQELSLLKDTISKIKLASHRFNFNEKNEVVLKEAIKILKDELEMWEDLKNEEYWS